MRNSDFIKVQHNATGKVADVPYTYLDIYPKTYTVISDSKANEIALEVEENKTVIALDDEVATPEKAKPSTKKEG